LKLFVVQSQQVRLRLLDLVKHLLSQFLGGLDLLPLLLVDGVVLDLDFVFKLLLEHGHLSRNFFLLTFKLDEGSILGL
jgi:hypothetical protein